MPLTQEPDPIREVVIEARRKQILEAAAIVFADKGYHRATIRDVAGRAGIADGTIYNYFDNKDDLLIGILNHVDQLEIDEEGLSGLSQKDFRAMFQTLLRQRMELFLPNIDMFKAVLPEILVNSELRDRYYGGNLAPTLAFLQAHLEARALDGHIRTDVRMGSHAITARAIVAMLIGFLVLHILGDPVIESEAAELPEALASLLYDGLRPSG